MPSNNKVNIVLSLLLNFINNEIRTDKVITENSSLDELGLNGLEGIIFIKKYSDEFKVNIDTLNFEHHFTNSSSNLKKTIKALTIKHLEKAIILGHFDNVILNEK